MTLDEWLGPPRPGVKRESSSLVVRPGGSPLAQPAPPVGSHRVLALNGARR